MDRQINRLSGLLAHRYRLLERTLVTGETDPRLVLIKSLQLDQLLLELHEVSDAYDRLDVEVTSQ